MSKLKLHFSLAYFLVNRRLFGRIFWAPMKSISLRLSVSKKVVDIVGILGVIPFAIKELSPSQ